MDAVAAPHPTSLTDYERGWCNGFALGYDQGARGIVSGNVVLILLPDADPEVHDRIRDRINQVLDDEGLNRVNVVAVTS